MNKLVLGISFFIFMGCINCSAQWQGGVDSDIKTLEGSVKEIDLEQSRLIFHTEEGDIELLVPRRVRIFQGTEQIAFSDIETKDVGVITYYYDKEGLRQVLSITLEE